MQITFTVDLDGAAPTVYTFASEREAVEQIQASIGVPMTGTWDQNTSSALLRTLNDEYSYFRANPDMIASLTADINAATAARAANAQQLKSALLIVFSGAVPTTITGSRIAPATINVPVAGGPAPAPPPPPGPRPEPRPNPNTPAPPPPPAEEKLLGLPKNVVIGVGIGAGVLVVGGLVLLALGGPAPARASGKARRR